MNELKEKLEKVYEENNTVAFIHKDPISIPHRFTLKEDIEVSAFLTSILTFGKRQIIINKANELMGRMNNSPFEFIMNPNIDKIRGFKHRTIDDGDMIFYIQSLQVIYQSGGLSSLFTNNIEDSLIRFRQIFVSYPHQKRAERHISDISSGSPAKRLNMFLRWMVRNDNIDFGIWTHIDKASLYIPMDVHVERVGRELGLLKRKTKDWKAVKELTMNLRNFCPEDPIKYDISLFSIGQTV